MTYRMSLYQFAEQTNKFGIDFKVVKRVKC